MITKTKTIRKEILEFIDFKGGSVTFAHLHRNKKFTGTRVMGDPETNIFSGFGVSFLTARALYHLVGIEALKTEATTVDLYLKDKVTPVAPLITRTDLTQPYSTPHWLPILVCKDVNFDKELAKYKK